MWWFTIIKVGRKFLRLGKTNPKTLMYGAIGIVSAVFIWFAVDFIGDKYEAEQEVTRLEQVVTDRDNTINVLNVQDDLRDNASNLEDLNRAEDAVLATSYQEARDAALSATEDQDAPIAPVMRDMLVYIDSLR